MEPFNIKKINFFKKNPSPPPKKKKNNHIPATLKKEIGFIKKIINSPYFYFVIFTISITILTTYIPSHSLPNFEEGEIASSNVVAPSDMTIEDTETTEKRKQEAADTVLPVYSLDENVSLNTEEKIRDLFNSGRDRSSFPSFCSSFNSRHFMSPSRVKYFLCFFPFILLKPSYRYLLLKIVRHHPFNSHSICRTYLTWFP